MHQVKFFKSVESEVSSLETEINAWIRNEGISVVNVFGNIAPQTVADPKAASSRAFAPSDIFVAVVYEAG